MRRKLKGAALTAAGMLLMAPGALVSSGGNDPDARFRGGSHDGFDRDSRIGTTTDWAIFPDRLETRFRGGAHDGYALELSLETMRKPRGLIILIR